MKIKQLMLVSLLLLAILTIGAVSASDGDDFDEALTVDNVDEASLDASLDDEVISESGDDDVVAALEDDEAISNDDKSDSLGDDNGAEILSDGNESLSPNGTIFNPGFNGTIIDLNGTVLPTGNSTSSVDVSVNDIFEGEDATIIYHFYGYSEGYVNTIIAGNSFHTTVSDGEGSLVVSGLQAGNYTISSSCYSSNGYNFCNEYSMLTVWPAEESIDYGDVELWIDTESEFILSPDDLSRIFATVTVPEGARGYVSFEIREDPFFPKSLDDFDEDYVDGTTYSITLGDDEGNFIFEGYDEEYFTFAFYDEDSNLIKSQDYLIFLENGTVRFEVLGEEEDEESFINQNEIITNPEDEDNYNPETVIATFKNTSIRQIIICLRDMETFLFNRNVTQEDFNDGVYEVHLVDLNLANIEDKDIIRFICLDDEGNLVEEYTTDCSIKVTDDSIQFYVIDDELFLEFYSFYGNLTTGILNNEPPMGWHPNGNLVEIYSPTQLDDLTVTLKSGEFIKTYSLEDMTEEYDYHSLGYIYTLELADNMVEELPENEVITFNYVCSDVNVTQKRIRQADYLYKVISVDDITYLFEICIADEELSDENDVAVTFNATGNANRQSIFFDLGGGFFSVYVNGKKVENLGRLVRIDYETELELFRLCGHEDAWPELSLTLADLGISEDGTYNIRVTHYPKTADGPGINYGEPDDELLGADEFLYVNETEVINMDVVVKLSGDEPSTSLIVTAEDITYGEDLVVRISTFGNKVVTLTIEGVVYSIQVIDGLGILTIPALNAGTYTIVATVNGDGNSTLLNSTEAIVNKALPTLVINTTELYAGEDFIVEFLIDEEATGSIDFSMSNGAGGQLLINNGKATFTLPESYPAGEYTVNATYAGDLNFLPTSATGTVTVIDKPLLSLNVTVEDVSYGEDIVVFISCEDTSINNALVLLNQEEGVYYFIKLVDGLGNATFSDLEPGTYEIAVMFEGDDHYAETVVRKNVTVNKLETFIVAEVCSLYSDEDFVVEFYLDEGATGVINYTISNGVSGSIEIDSEMGIGVLELDCMPAGVYTIDAVYLGDDFYAPASVSVNATIIDKPFLPLTVTVDDVDYGEDLLVFISSDRTVEVYVMLGDDEGTMFMIELVDCSGNWTYEDLDSGVYDVTVIFPGDDLFNETTVHKNATVKKINPIVEVYGAEFYYCDIGYVDVSIDGDTEIESVSVVGYPDADVSCDSDNVISISGLPVGNYVLLVTTKETTNYNSVNATGNLNVTKVIVRNDNIGEFFTSDGSLISEYPELVFEGEFSDMTFNINKPVTLLGQDATFNNARFLIDSDDVSIVNMIMNYAGNDSVVSANGVSNFNLLNNYIAYTGQASNNYAVNITDSTGILLKDNYVQASGVDYLHGIVISADNFTIDGNTLIITSAENACGINIYGPSKGAVENNELLIKAKKTVYSINTNPATGAVQVRYINNTINSEAYFVVGIYDDSEAIQDNTIILSGNYAIGIVVLSDGSNVTDNNITLNTTNNGTDEEVHDDNVDVNVTSGIVVKNNATISNNTIDSSDKAISVVEGASEISGNTLTGEVTIESSGNTISGNDMTGQVTVEGSDNIISTNVIKNNNGHAVVLKTSAVGNTVNNNECYSVNGNGNDAVADQNGGNTVINNKVNPGLTISIAGFEEGSTSSIVITANENFTGTVNINITINGAVSQTYTVSVENGTGNTTIKGLTAGTYTAEASSVINDNFTSGQAFCNFTVTAKPAPDSGSGSSSAQGSTQTQTSAASTTAPAKEAIKLTLKTVKVKKSAKKLILKATLKINGKKVKGKVVKFKFNGKTYKAKTNKKGIAKVTIKKAVLKKLKVGKKVKYQASYGGITVKKSVKVKK